MRAKRSRQANVIDLKYYLVALNDCLGGYLRSLLELFAKNRVGLAGGSMEVTGITRRPMLGCEMLLTGRTDWLVADGC